MGISALVIGYGSIGSRHAKLLSNMDMISNVSVLSSQENVPFATIKTLEEIEDINPDYIVIASNTALHLEQLTYIEEKFSNKIILVEKPLFDKFSDFQPSKNSVMVAYVLRFHPVLKIIQEKIHNKKIWNVNIVCGSYLPEWRPGRDYRQTSSAKIETGGGVLLDLSHELDYVQWLFGAIEIDYVFNNKISDLAIETDDLLILNGSTKSGVRINISLNYFTRKPVRQIIIDGEDISIQADLISNKAFVHIGERFDEYSWDSIERDQMFYDEHKEALNDENEIVCNYLEGLETMKLIDEIKAFK